jgi:hypothetical protein
MNVSMCICISHALHLKRATCHDVRVRMRIELFAEAAAGKFACRPGSRLFASPKALLVLMQGDVLVLQ